MSFKYVVKEMSKYRQPINEYKYTRVILHKKSEPCMLAELGGEPWEDSGGWRLGEHFYYFDMLRCQYYKVGFTPYTEEELLGMERSEYLRRLKCINRQLKSLDWERSQLKEEKDFLIEELNSFSRDEHNKEQTQLQLELFASGVWYE